jgi:DNA mismatch repair protein MutS2
MDEHTLRLLEFDTIRSELCGLCASPRGASRIMVRGFETDPRQLEDSSEMSLAFRAALETGTPLPGLDFPDVTKVISILSKQGSEPDGEELAALGRHILSALKLKRFVLKCASNARLRLAAQSIPDLTSVSRRIFQVLDPEGNLKEKRIPELAVIRERIRRYKDEAERSARGMLDAETSRTYWQTNLPTLRDGRLVLPLKSQFKGRVKGIVHELSASGSTVFIEPLEIVEKNNAIVQEEGRYRQEVRRILRELASELSGRHAELSVMADAVADLDEICARARYALIHGCRAAEPGGDAADLRDARHPLLSGSCVPISVTAGGESRVLIVTGPNTGGKTVSLKTVGLMALMNQFGLEIPAADGSALPVFDDVFADIGDEQSIEQSLSTFSAHVTNLARIVDRSTARSLVLLDELGAGTDPEEGVALAMALLDHFILSGAVVLATTHHGILKNYGYTRKGVQNASMGFDRESLEPTYRILMGVPGESHALEIARRRGMPSSVMESASAYLNDERTDVSHLVQNLSERHRKLAQAEEEHRAKETDFREKKRQTDLKELTLRQKELELRRLGLKEMRDFLSAIRKEWESLRGKVNTGSDSRSEGGNLLGRLQERIETEEQRIQADRESLTPKEQFDVREGMEVVIRSTGRKGRILRKDRGKRWVVETETLRLSLSPWEMRPAEPEEHMPSDHRVSYSTAAQAELPSLEIDLRGQRLDEALRRLEKQIDSALIHGLSQFGVIHGKGEGILMKAIHEYLGKSRNVKDYWFSSPEEGGFGKTHVVLSG